MAKVVEIAEASPIAGWRFKLGAGLFVLSLFGPPILLPLIVSLGFSAAKASSISGFVLLGADLLLFVAAAVMGKDGYAYLKSLIFGFLRRYGPPQVVGSKRYYTGLAMLCVSVFVGWIGPYFWTWVSAYRGSEVAIGVGGDFLLLVSLFILGGEFWDKLRALFVYNAKAQFVQK